MPPDTLLHVLTVYAEVDTFTTLRTRNEISGNGVRCDFFITFREFFLASSFMNAVTFAEDLYVAYFAGYRLWLVLHLNDIKQIELYFTLLS